MEPSPAPAATSANASAPAAESANELESKEINRTNDGPINHVAENQRYWDAMADDWVASGEQSWAAKEPFWGIWKLPERDLKMLPEDMKGTRAVELGCGTGYVSWWMRQRGATVLAVDNSAKQLDTARRLAKEYGAGDGITFVHGNAESIDQPSGTFDFAISEYGAAIWCDPLVWIPEAHRLLRPGGRLVFLGNHPLAEITIDPTGEKTTTTLHRPYLNMHRLDWTAAEHEPGGVEFSLPIGRWIELFVQTGFEIEEYIEPSAPQDASGRSFCSSADWARKWPSEHVWKLRKK
jgi:SAM-dependent methyltransferase